jgi:eukaryotic-like serine/threonine-protein kinase
LNNLTSHSKQIDELLYIDSACNEYEIGFRQGKAPKLEDVVASAPEHLQLQLVIELIEFELLVRKERHETPSLEEYLTRFPQWSQEIHTSLQEVFGKLSRASGIPWEAPGYEIESEIGRGGMGVVYKARQTNLDRIVALKKAILSTDASESEAKRFRLEAEAVARLQHPHIVQIFEVGQSQGIPYFTMEYLEGGSLSAHLANSPMHVIDAARLVHTLALAMSYAHSMGIVHRDLKPANILLKQTSSSLSSTTKEPKRTKSHLRLSNSSRVSWRSGNLSAGLYPKIADFGLAKQLHSNQQQTQTGTILGTPSYMAPEQTTGQANHIGPLTDVYSLGAILYECIVGAPPFRAASALDTIEQVRTKEPIPPSKIQSRVPRDLETICLKCLEKTSDRRYTSALELAEDLGRFLESNPIRARPINRFHRIWRWAKRRPMVASLLVCVATLIAAIVIVPTLLVVELKHALEESSRNERDANVARIEAENKSIESQSRLVGMHISTGVNRALANDPLRATLWYSQAWLDDVHHSRDDREHRMRIGFSLSQLPELVGVCIHKNAIAETQISVDSQRLILSDGSSKACVWNPFLGVKLGELDHGTPITRVGISRTGSVGFTCGGSIITIWNLESLTSLHTLQSPGGEATQFLSAELSPDGQCVAACSTDGHVAIWSVTTGERLVEKQIANAPARSVQHAPDGSFLIIVDDKHGITSMRTRDGDLTKTGASHGHDGKHSDNPFVCLPQFTQNGKHLLVHHQRSLDVWDTSTWTLLSRRSTQADMIDLSLSANGQRLVATTGAAQARLIAFDDRFPTDIGSVQPIELMNPRNTHLCSISNDGKLAATSSSSGIIEIWNGVDGKRRLSLKTFAVPRQLRFLPTNDGNYLLLVAGSDGVIRLWRMNANATNPNQLVETPYTYTCGRSHYAGLIKRQGVNHLLSPDSKSELRVNGKTSELIQRESKERIEVMPSHSRDIKFVSFSDNGRRILTSDGIDVRVYDLDAKKYLELPLGEKSEIVKLRMSSDGSRLMAYRAPKQIQVFEIDSGSVLLNVVPGENSVERPNDLRRILESNEISEPTLTPDGKHIIVAAHAEARSLVFRVSDGGKEFETDCQRGVPVPYVFSKDGNRVALANSDTRARVWSLVSKLPVGPLLQHPTYVRHASLSLDGRMIATIAADQKVRIWNAETGDLIGDCENLAPRGQTWFHGNGQNLVLRKESGEMSEVNLPVLALRRESLRDFFDLLCCERIEHADGIVEFTADHFRQNASAYLDAWKQTQNLR